METLNFSGQNDRGAINCWTADRDSFKWLRASVVNSQAINVAHTQPLTDRLPSAAWSSATWSWSRRWSASTRSWTRRERSTPWPRSSCATPSGPRTTPSGATRCCRKRWSSFSPRSATSPLLVAAAGAAQPRTLAGRIAATPSGYSDGRVAQCDADDRAGGRRVGGQQTQINVWCFMMWTAPSRIWLQTVWRKSGAPLRQRVLI